MQWSHVDEGCECFVWMKDVITRMDVQVVFFFFLSYNCSKRGLSHADARCGDFTSGKCGDFVFFFFFCRLDMGTVVCHLGGVR